jgi:hypothetical protein
MAGTRRKSPLPKFVIYAFIALIVIVAIARIFGPAKKGGRSVGESLRETQPAEASTGDPRLFAISYNENRYHPDSHRAMERCKQ